MYKSILIFLTFGIAILGTAGAFPENMIQGDNSVIIDFAATFESPFFYENSMTRYTGFDFDNSITFEIQKMLSRRVIA
jgi:hypothetical protein